MNEEAQMCLDEAKEGMENALLHLDREFQKIRAGKAGRRVAVIPLYRRIED